MLTHITALAVFFSLSTGALSAAPECPVPAYTPKSGNQITDWHDKYISPSLTAAGRPATPRPTKDQAEALVERLQAFHQLSISDPLFFEALAQKISSQYGTAGDFVGLNTSTAEKLYKSGDGANVDFSVLCIDTRRTRFPEDTFAITLFGVNNNHCRHASLRGLVFTSTLINGAANGECRPDHAYTRNLIFPVAAGTNTITFVCDKDAHGCARR